VGGDPRADRRFKTIGQGRRYDPGATLAAAWLPELAALPPALRHAPHRVSDEEAAAHGFVPGSYPPPLVDPGAQEPAGPLGAKAQRRRDRRVRP
jgi:deoxyribodipyrimidine photo-lyase